MSFSERVKKTNEKLQLPSSRRADLLERLRMQIQESLPIERLARLAKENPGYARNEVRSASERVFEQPEWSQVTSDERQELIEKLLDSIFGFGILEDYLNDESITEVIANGPSSIFFERDGILHQSNLAFQSEDELRTLIDRIVGPLGRRIDEASPMVNARLPQGHRVHAVIPPIALDGPYLTIRKFSEHVITLDEMQASGSIDQSVKTFLVWAVRTRKNIAVSGGTGSGKTTLLNALSCVIDPTERIVTIEDSAELRFLDHPDVARLEARPSNAEGSGEVTIRDLVIHSLRMRPDRIIVGECRGAEALDMLQAMNTGHDGSLTTLHANSPEDSIARLTTMVRYEADLPVDVIEANIATAIHLVIQTQRGIDGHRYVSQIAVFSFDKDLSRCVTHTLYERAINDAQGRWLMYPNWLDEVSLKCVATEEEVQSWKRICSS